MLKRDECKMTLTMKSKLKKKLCFNGKSKLEDSSTIISGSTNIENLDDKSNLKSPFLIF